MGLFMRGTPPSLDDILDCKSVEGLLASLNEEVPFYTVGQVQEYLRDELPTGLSAHFAQKIIRAALHQLEDAGYVGSESVELLPALTISQTPIFSYGGYRDESQPYTFADAKRHASIVRERVPRLDCHQKARLYFARDIKTREWLQKRGYGALCTYEREVGRRSEDRFKRLLEWHLAVEGQRNPSPYEIAGTGLTAAFNVAQLRFMDCYRPKNPKRGRCAMPCPGHYIGGRNNDEEYLQFLVFETKNPGKDAGGSILTRSGSYVLMFLPPMPEHLLFEIVTKYSEPAIHTNHFWWM